MGYNQPCVYSDELYRDWINHLKDRTARARIQVRVDRLAPTAPNPGPFAILAKVCLS